jgi:site-specific DNA-cytosine methylase
VTRYEEPNVGTGVDIDTAQVTDPETGTPTNRQRVFVVTEDGVELEVSGTVDVSIASGLATKEKQIESIDVAGFSKEFRSADSRPTESRYAERMIASSTITPAAGKAIRIRKIGWLPYDEPNTVLLRWADEGSGAKNIWRSNATQQTILETGETDRVLEVVLFNTKPIDVNVHYEEITP